MKKKKGLSFDEKKDKMLKIFHETQSVFNYDEVEKLSVKAGISFPYVKEILKSLQADDLVNSEKIGAGVFYWSFPSKAMMIVDMPPCSMKPELRKAKSRLPFTLKNWQRCKNRCKFPWRDVKEQRQNVVQKLSQLKQEQSILKKDIAKYIRFDPERVALLKKQNNELKTAINLQTDNLQQIKKYIKKQQPGIKNIEIEQCYEIPVDLQYLD